MKHKGTQTIGGGRRWSRWLCVPLALALGSLLLAAPTAMAARAAGPLTFVVTSTADTVGMCLSVETPYVPSTCTLRTALYLANANDPGPGNHNTIAISATGTILLGSALPVLSRDVAIQGPPGTAIATTVDGGHAARVFVVGSGVTATIERLGIANGKADNTDNGDGGGILNHGTLTVSMSAISGGSAHNGGGIANVGTLTMANCAITGNTVPAGNAGGGIFNSGTLTVTACDVSNNSAPYVGEGGGIFNTGAMTVINSTIHANSASIGGGLSSAYGGTAIVVSSTIAENSATFTGGGGILNRGRLALTNSTVTLNSRGERRPGRRHRQQRHADREERHDRRQPRGERRRHPQPGDAAPDEHDRRGQHADGGGDWPGHHEHQRRGADHRPQPDRHDERPRPRRRRAGHHERDEGRHRQRHAGPRQARQLRRPDADDRAAGRLPRPFRRQRRRLHQQRPRRRQQQRPARAVPHRRRRARRQRRWRVLRHRRLRGDYVLRRPANSGGLVPGDQHVGVLRLRMHQSLKVTRQPKPSPAMMRNAR